MRKNATSSVQSAVIDVIRAVMELGGHDIPDLSGDICPVGQLGGFDSLVGVEATVMLEEKLGITIAPESAFVDADARRPLSIDEVVRKISQATAESALG